MFQLSHHEQVRVGVVGNISACHADAPGVGKPTTTKNSGCKSAKECGNTNNNKKPVCRDFDFDPKKSVRKTKEIPRIRHRSACKFPTKKCGKITNKKVCRVFDFEKKKNVKKTKEIPRIRHRSACKFMAKK